MEGTKIISKMDSDLTIYAGEPSQTCKRADCVIERGSTWFFANNVAKRYDKAGFIIPPSATAVTATESRECVTCGKRWALETYGRDDVRVVEAREVDQ